MYDFINLLQTSAHIHVSHPGYIVYTKKKYDQEVRRYTIQKYLANIILLFRTDFKIHMQVDSTTTDDACIIYYGKSVRHNCKLYKVLIF